MGSCGRPITNPSHLWWQGINPVEAIRLLGGDVIKHFHAKDVQIDPAVTAQIGVRIHLAPEVRPALERLRGLLLGLGVSGTT